MLLEFRSIYLEFLFIYLCVLFSTRCSELLTGVVPYTDLRAEAQVSLFHA